MRHSTTTTILPCVLTALTFLLVTDVHAFDTNVPQTFNELCQPDASGYPADPDVVNCWGFERDEDFFYHDSAGQSSNCRANDGRHVLAEHPNGTTNPTPIQNASVNSTTCLYPERVSEYSTSGTHSLKIVQIDEDGANSGGTFAPYFKHYIGGDGKRKFVGFGAGGELWIHWRYRQNNELFNYHSKRFMVTHKFSAYEHVLTAFGSTTYSTSTPPYRYVCAYAYKGLQGHGCSANVFYEANKWHTFIMHVKTPDTAGNGGLFELYMDGQKIIENDDFHNSRFAPADVGAYNDALDWDTQQELDVLMRLDFLLFENGKRGSGPRPMGAMYIDDVIVARKELPTIISGVGANQSPRPPTGLQAN